MLVTFNRKVMAMMAGEGLEAGEDKIQTLTCLTIHMMNDLKVMALRL